MTKTLNLAECVEADLAITRGINFEIVSQKSWSEGDYHQAILNSYYDLWQRGKFRGYSDMVGAALARNPLHAFAILMGKFNQQVENGGAIQYYDNGYASLERGSVNRNRLSSRDNEEINICLHGDLVSLYKKYMKPYYKGHPEFRVVLNLMENFTVYLKDYEDMHGECQG